MGMMLYGMQNIFNVQHAILPLFETEVDTEKVLELVKVSLFSRDQLQPVYTAKQVRLLFANKPSFLLQTTHLLQSFIITCSHKPFVCLCFTYNLLHKSHTSRMATSPFSIQEHKAEVLEPRPHVKAYAARITGRPGFQKCLQ